MRSPQWWAAIGCAVAVLFLGLAPAGPAAAAACQPAPSNTVSKYEQGVLQTLIDICGASQSPPASEAHVGQVGGTTANPTSTLTRPSDTTAYAQNDLVASSTTAGSVVVPSLTVTRVAAGGAQVVRLRLVTNKTSGWDAAAFRVRLWTAAPTYTNGDNGAYAVATGAASLVGKFNITLDQYGDGAAGVAGPADGPAAFLRLAAGSVIYWDVQYTGSASLTPASGQTFTLTAELGQD